MRKHLLALSLPFFLFLISFHAFAQVKISGIVLSGDDKAPLPGVNVVVKGTTIGTATDVNGAYTLDLADANGVILTFSYIGFVPQSIPAPAVGGVVNVTLEADVKLQNESVVIGYGTTLKRDLTGSVASIGSKDFQKGVITTPDALIAGKVAGVQITSGGGSPGQGSTIRIRGASSLSASNDPLIVIDGIPVDNGGIAGSPNPLSLINPNDIENMTVLKDASATAIYGSRASNGVIIITSKRGTVMNNGKPKFGFNSSNSIAFINRYVNTLNADEYRKFIDDSGTVVQKRLLKYNPTKNTGGNGDTLFSTDWQKEIYQPAFATDNSLTMTGAVAAIPYRVSLGYLGQNGILKRDKFDRVSAAINLSPTFLDNALKATINFKSIITQSQFADKSAIGNAILFDPTKPVFSRDSSLIGNGGVPKYGGYYEWLDASKRPNTLSQRNPVGLLNQRNDKGQVLRSLANIQLDYALPFLPALRANLNIGYDYSKGSGGVQVPDSAAVQYATGTSNVLDSAGNPIINPRTNLPFKQTKNIGGTRSQYNQTKLNRLVEFYLNYTKGIPAIDSKLEVVGGTSFQDFYTEIINFRDRTFAGDTLSSRPAPKFPNDKPQNRLASFYGRGNFTIANKYILTSTLRYDGSSRFAADSRWGLFPSAALAWKIGEERLFKQIRSITELKVRLGYGRTGQQDVGNNYPFQPNYNLSTNTAQYQLGNQFYNMYRPNAYDSKIKWEETTTYNAGIDYGLFNDRIYGSLDVYFKVTSDLLNIVPTAGGSNLSDQVLTNVGNMQNKGLEFSINTNPILREDFRWDIGFNFTYNENKITKLNSAEDPSSKGNLVGGIFGGVGSTAQIQSVGYPSNSFFLYKQLYDVNGKILEGRYADLNNDGQITDADQYRTKQSAPKILLGATTTFDYKNFSLSTVVRGTFGNFAYNNVASIAGNTNSALLNSGFLSNLTQYYFDDSLSGRLKGSDNSKLLLSDYYLKNAGFVKIDNLSLSYNLKDVIKSNGYGMIVSFTVQNVATYTKYKGIDPEIFSGIDINIYPRPRTFVVGLNFQF